MLFIYEMQHELSSLQILISNMFAVQTNFYQYLYIHIIGHSDTSHFNEGIEN